MSPKQSLYHISFTTNKSKMIKNELESHRISKLYIPNISANLPTEVYPVHHRYQIPEVVLQSHKPPLLLSGLPALLYHHVLLLNHLAAMKHQDQFLGLRDNHGHEHSKMKTCQVESFLPAREQHIKFNQQKMTVKCRSSSTARR